MSRDLANFTVDALLLIVFLLMVIITKLEEPQLRGWGLWLQATAVTLGLLTGIAAVTWLWRLL